MQWNFVNKFRKYCSFFRSCNFIVISAIFQWFRTRKYRLISSMLHRDCNIFLTFFIKFLDNILKMVQKPSINIASTLFATLRQFSSIETIKIMQHYWDMLVEYWSKDDATLNRCWCTIEEMLMQHWRNVDAPLK